MRAASCAIHVDGRCRSRFALGLLVCIRSARLHPSLVFVSVSVVVVLPTPLAIPPYMYYPTFFLCFYSLVALPLVLSRWRQATGTPPAAGCAYDVVMIYAVVAIAFYSFGLSYVTRLSPAVASSASQASSFLPRVHTYTSATCFARRRLSLQFRVATSIFLSSFPPTHALFLANSISICCC